MHTTIAEKTTFNHNGDYSGDVKITVPRSLVSTFASATEQYCDVTVPFEDIRKLVFAYLRDKLIEKVEQMSDDELAEYYAA